MTGQFTATGPLGRARSNPLAVTLNDGRVLVVGLDEVQGPSTELYDTATGRYSPGPDATNAGVSGTARLLDGRVFVLTGSRTAEIFDPATDGFSVSGSTTVARSGANVVPLLDGCILVAGGSALAGWMKTTEIFDPATGLFSPTGTMTDVPALGTLTRLADGRVLAAGGIDPTSLQFAPGGEVYDPATGTWSPVGFLVLPR